MHVRVFVRDLKTAHPRAFFNASVKTGYLVARARARAGKSKTRSHLVTRPSVFHARG